MFGAEELDHRRGIVFGPGAGQLEEFAVDQGLDGSESLVAIGGYGLLGIVVGVLLYVELVDAQIFEAEQGDGGVIEDQIEPFKLAIVGLEVLEGGLDDIDKAADLGGETAVALWQFA